MTVLDKSGRQTEAMLSAWHMSWSHRGGRGALELRCSGSDEMDSFFVGCCQKAEYEKRLASVLARIREQGELPCCENWKYLLWSVQADRLWLVDRHHYWCRDCKLKLRRRKTRTHRPISAGSHNINSFAIPLCHREMVSVKATRLVVGVIGN